MDNDHTISKYDRTYGGMHDVCLKTKGSTIKNIELTGRSETFIVQTMRHAELGDFIFVEYVDEARVVVRLALPPKVANVIASQRDSLTTRRRSIAGKAEAQRRMDRGERPAFLRKRK
jgi:hypothetical protein